MKKIFNKCLLALAVVPFFTMCSKTNEMVQHGQVTITANIEDTKVSLTQGEEKLVLSWEEGDALNVIGTTTEKFTIKSGFTAKSAKFTGNEVTGSTFDIVYPAKYESVDAITARSYAGQVQDGNGSTAHLEYNAVVADADDYKVISFAKGAAGVKMNGALKLVVKLPDDVTAVSSLKLTAPTAIFFTTNGTSDKSESLSMSFTNTTIGDDHTLTAYMMTSWQDVTIAADTKLTLEVTAPEQSSFYSKTFHCTTEQTISGGATFVIDISSATLAYTLKGSGTETDPYLLYTAQDMVAMNSLLVTGEKKYFKMMADIDMDGINWVGGNQDSPYKQHIDFNGDSHTIKNLTFDTDGKYPGLVGVLSGKVANVTFENPSVTSTKHAGVVCGYAGSSGTNPAIVENVIITGAVVTQNGKSHTGLVFGHSNIASCEFTNITAAGIINQNGIGDSGFIGGAQNIAATFTNCHTSGTLTISSSLEPTNGTSLPSGGIQGYDAASTYTNCSFTGTINGGRLCGGIVGYNTKANTTLSGCYVAATLDIKKHGSKSSSECCGGLVGFLTGGTISNCYTKGSITILSQIAGGIAGNIKGLSTITNCWSSMNITAARGAAGIAARVASDSWNYNADKCLEISGCVYFGTKIDVGEAAYNNGSSGSILGMTALKNVFSNCWRINDSKFTFVNTGNPVNKPVDQPGCDGSNWSVSANVTDGEASQIGTGTEPQQYLFPYWGKAAEVDATVCSIVTSKSLGWDTDIWDLSGDYPTLKNNPEPEL